MEGVAGSARHDSVTGATPTEGRPALSGLATSGRHADREQAGDRPVRLQAGAAR